VLASKGGDRYALTLWLVSESDDGVCDETHPLAETKRGHFPEDADAQAPVK